MLFPLEKCKPLLAYPQHLNNICQHFESQPLLCLSQTKVICVVLCSIMTVSLTAFPTFGTQSCGFTCSIILQIKCHINVAADWPIRRFQYAVYFVTEGQLEEHFSSACCSTFVLSSKLFNRQITNTFSVAHMLQIGWYKNTTCRSLTSEDFPEPKQKTKDKD